jgi:hypothetical protein
MSNLIPLPAPIPVPPPFLVPDADLALPSFRPPAWEPVPIYRDDVPALNPKPAAEEGKEGEEEQKEEPVQGSDSAPMPELPTAELPPLPDLPTMDTIELPGGFEVPVPPQEILVTAVTTAGTAAVVSVGATMAATNLFKRIVNIAKPAIKAVLKKVAKLRGKKPPLTWARQRQLELRQHIRDRKHSRGGS